jgi:hypothetical protein
VQEMTSVLFRKANQMMKQCANASEIPDEEHFAIIIFSNRIIHHGHGQYNYDENILEQQYFCSFSREDWPNHWN